MIPKIQLETDTQLIIARGNSRKDIRWKNTTLAWSDLLARLATTTRTPELQAEYFAMTKAQQDDIKDVGGFVGGALSGGRRKSDTVTFRQLVALDADFAKPGLHHEIMLLAPHALAIYSTHKHTPEKPRLRVLIPLHRPVTPDEYKAIARRLAADIGIDYFDDSTYDPSRLMYWPSTSRDAEYLFEYTDAALANADEILASYPDWRDASFWPVSSRAKEERQKLADKQGDPLAKPGLVGAFCRAYDIPAALETFLADVYEPTEDPNRYTYTKGSTTGGLVVYDGGLFAYSHHGTDPAGGKLLNAFDLVRVHLFGAQDADTPASAPVNKLPSYRAMLTFCGEDKGVREALGRERLAIALDEFGAVPDEEPPADPDWLQKLELEKGRFKETINNVVLILENDPFLAGRIGLNAFSQRPVTLRPLPWSKTPGSPWADADDAALRHYIERTYKIGSPGKIADALAVVLERHQFHPVRDYLDGLTWDGEARLDTVFIDYQGAEDCPYTRAVTRKCLVAAVARVRRPGVKFDYMPVLVGPQGTGKSQLIDRLGMGWYSDSLSTVSGKDAYEALQGYWLIEMGELTATRKAEVEAVKHFISKREDVFRVAYGRRTSAFPRQCIFIGTTNDQDFLRDKTGNRRFWPVDVDLTRARLDLWRHLTPEIVGQIWAEADLAYAAGEPLVLDAETSAAAIERQEAHTEESSRMGPIMEYLAKPIPADWYELDALDRRDWLNGNHDAADPLLMQRKRVCILELWVEALGGEVKQLSPLMTRELHEIMRALPGWQAIGAGSGKLRFGYFGVQRGYIRS